MNTTSRTIATAIGAALVAGGTLAATPGTAVSQPQPVTAASAHVTDGWSAVVLAPRNKTTAPGTLYLVSPSGAQYKVATGVAAVEQVADVAHDGSRILLGHYVNDHVGGSAYRLVDVRTGASTAVAGRWDDLRFTHPSGQALAGRTMTAKGIGGVVRTDLAGHVAVRYSGTTSGTNWLQSPDGVVLVASTAHGLQVNGNATGRVLRTLPNPAGASGCDVQHFSDATHFTASCMPKDVNGPIQVYRFSTSGGAPVAVTAKLSTRPNSWLQFGYLDSWTTPSGQVVTVASSCGAPHLGLVRGTAPRAFTTLKDGSQPLGLVGDSVYYLDALQCDDVTATLSRHDVATNRNTVLAGGQRNPGTWVRSAVLVDAKR